VHSSHDGHMTEYDALILCDMGMHCSHSNWGSGHDLGCDKGGPWGGVGCGQDQSAQPVGHRKEILE